MSSSAKPPLRALHVYSGNLFGGVETFLLTLSKTTPTAEFALCFDGRLTSELGQRGARVHRLGEVRVRNPLSVWRARRKLRALLDTKQFDVIVCHSHWSQAIFGPVVRRRKIPLVFYLHDASHGKHWIERWAALTPPALAVTNSRFTANTLSATYPHVKQAVVYLPVFPSAPSSPEERATIRREFETELDATVIVQVSRLESYKGHRLLLAALGELREQPGWIAWIVGGAQRSHEIAYLEDLKRVAKERGVADRLRFVGQRTDVPRILRAADIHCQPNVGPEPFGIAFIEALGAGLPVVTTALGGALEIVDDSCGVLVPVDAHAVAGALQDLLTNATTRAGLAANAPARANALCDPETQSRALTEILEGVSGRS